MIVGFPSESGEEFEISRRFMEEIGFDNAFIFKYSPRPGTRAADWIDDVPAEEKMRRNQVLLEDQNERGRSINRRLIGTEVQVLVQGVSPRNPARWSGRTRTNKIVVFEPARQLAPGDFVAVAVDRVEPQTLYGVLV